MKKRLTVFLAIGLMALGVVAQDREHMIRLGDMMKPKGNTYAFNLNQNLRTTDSPTFAGLTIGTAHPILDSGIVPLTADWNVGAFDLTAVDMTASGTLTGSNITAPPTLSVEALTNVAGWTAAGNWTYGAGVWSHTTGDATALTATGETAIVAGTKYEIVMTITTSTAGGGLAVSLGGQSFAAVSTGAPTTYTFNVTASSTAALAITPTSGTWVGSLTISVKIVTQGQINAEGITLNSGQLLLSNGNATYPVIAPIHSPTTGMFFHKDGITINSPTYTIQMIAGTNRELLSKDFAWFYVPEIGLSSTSAAPMNLYLRAAAAATLQLGGDAAAPVAQTIKAHNGSGTDKDGADLTNQGGASTGTAVSGSLRQQTAYVAGTGSTANTYYTRQFIDGKVHTVSNNSATAMFSIANADGNAVGGYINYTVEVTDGTDIQLESGTFTFAAVNKATETWTTDADKGTVSAVVSAGTLAVTWAVDTATADTVKVTVNSNSSLTPTSSKVQFQIFLNSPKVITIL